ncbi:MAG: monovalent cation/H(+) antiporter subunit G [Rhodospirillales bacterium]|nr:monovalent cation/H(+) antiporter subunit G [Rhodospirillales bacterium]
MDALLDMASWACLIGGSIFSLIGVLGILRFPDVYTRMHAASLVETLGIGLILLGLSFQAGLSLVSVKLALIFIFLFFTNPTTTHALARALNHAGIKPYVTKKDKSS